MAHWNLYDQVAASIPFTLRGYNGNVVVYYGVNDDPVKAGMDSIPGLNQVLDLTYGYPVIHARIQEYAGSGYRTFCGWLQIITSAYFDSQDGKLIQTNKVFSVDIAPTFGEADVPFFSSGFMPELFDAPCLNLGNHTELHWTADAFLVSIPIKSREEGITRLLGFRWGYRENNIPDQKPEPFPLEITDAQTWTDHLPFLQKQYPKWKFNTA